MANKLRKIFENLITEDDKKRGRVDYDVGKTIDKYIKKVQKLKIEDLVI